MLEIALEAVELAAIAGLAFHAFRAGKARARSDYDHTGAVSGVRRNIKGVQTRLDEHIRSNLHRR